MVYGDGLTDDLGIPWGARTPRTEDKDVPKYQKLITSSSEKKIEYRMERVYPFSAKQCFQLIKDHVAYLKVTLEGNKVLAEANGYKDFNAAPAWVRNGDDGKVGTVGALSEFAYFFSGVVYWQRERVTILDEGSTTDSNGNPVYKYGWETATGPDGTKPDQPLKGAEVKLVLTTFQNDKNKCHLTWFRRFDEPRFMGAVPLGSFMKNSLSVGEEHEMETLWVYYHATFGGKIPSKSSKIAVIGAGPSGLLMAYQLIQRGVNPKNLTILEKDERYGGKTLSIPDSSEVQIKDPVFNPPPPRGLREVAEKYTKAETYFEIAEKLIKRETVTAEEGEMIVRKNTPNALQYKKDYYSGGETIFHELGTCYLSPGYYAIRTLLREIQAKVEKKCTDPTLSKKEKELWESRRDQSIVREVGPDTYSMEFKGADGEITSLGLDAWVFEVTKASTNLDEIFCCAPNLGAGLAIISAKVEYCKLHAELLGEYSYTMPPRPLPSNMNDLAMNFGDFLRKDRPISLAPLEPLMTYAMTAQGYGVIDKTPTLLAMQWLTPDLLDGYFEWYYFFSMYKNSVGEQIRSIPTRLNPDFLKQFDNYRKGMLVSGWGALWDRIVELYDLGKPDEKQTKIIKYGSNIKKIVRNVGKPPKVNIVYSHQGRDVEEQFDYLVVACPLSDAYENPTVPILNLDFTDEEKDLFLNPNLTASKFRTTLFKPDKPGPYEIDHLRIFVDNIRGVDGGHGDVFGVRDSYKAVQPRLSTEGGHRWDPKKGLSREKMCYQYVSPPVNGEKKMSEAELQEKFLNFLLPAGKDGKRIATTSNEYLKAGTTKERVESSAIKKHEKAWTYYTHYEADALVQGKLWDILEIQGKNNTIFVHASTNFESVLDIYNYNNMLLDGFSGRLDTLEQPPSDTRPQIWARPKMYLGANYFNGRLLLRRVLNFILTILWTVWYIISYPFAELLYLRVQRRQLQVAFETKDLGNWWEYNMSKFIDVSPTARGYINAYQGKPNGIPDPIPKDWNPTPDNPTEAEGGAGDGVFKILQDPKNNFRTLYPHIPDYKTVQASIEWNLQDFRTGVRHWVLGFDDGFNPWMGPRVQSIIRFVDRTAPNFYSWFFSWVFASQFRLLIGYSYRFEDEKGGGLRIPDCNMLRTAIKDHGREAGQRICLTVCKVFTEEVMRKKKMSIDFEPDFLASGGLTGTGCTVRMYPPKEHAYSNHSLWEFRTKKETKEFETIDMTW